MRFSARSLLNYVVGFTLCIWLLFFLGHQLSDPCEARAYTHVLCTLYAKGVIDGDLCPKLCLEPTHYLHSCRKDQPHYRLFTFHDSTVKVKNSRFLPESLGSQHDFGMLADFTEPAEVTSPSSFHAMILRYLEVKLGASRELDALVMKILRRADIDNDGEVSLAEARSIWALIHHQEFLLLLLFQYTPYVARLHGYCGDLFTVERVPHRSLYNELDKDSLFSNVFPGYYLFGIPSWLHRAQIAIGMVEFMFEVYEHECQASFLMCDLDPARVGYTSQYDVKFYDFQSVVPEAELGLYLGGVECRSDADCVWERTCRSRCDTATKLCSQTAYYPNLFYSCHIIQTYLHLGMPKNLRGDMENMYDRCFQLNASLPDFHLKHSLVLLDLKSLLWQQLS